MFSKRLFHASIETVSGLGFVISMLTMKELSKLIKAMKELTKLYECNGSNQVIYH